MASFENKKLALLRIFQILEKYSDENHMLSVAEIKRKIQEIYLL